MLVNAVFENMADALVEKERIEIRGFGSFKVIFYKGYTGRNPKTGEGEPKDGIQKGCQSSIRRYPTPGSVKRYRGRVGSSSSLRRRLRMKIRK